MDKCLDTLSILVLLAKTRGLRSLYAINQASLSTKRGKQLFLIEFVNDMAVRTLA